MSRTIRFPLLKAVPSVGIDESGLVITLLNQVATLLKGGGSGGVYADITPWKTVMRETEAPYSCVVIEFSANAELIIGNGTFAQQIGLFGGITNPNTGTIERFLIGILGTSIGGATFQVPITTTNGGADLVGFAQKVSDVACYDLLSVGGVYNDIALAGEQLVTVKARPIRSREYLG